MRKGLLISLAAAGLAAVLGVTPVLAAATYGQIGQVTNFPGTVKAFDISWFDTGSQNYLLADRTNKRVDVVNGTTGKFTQAIASADNPFQGAAAGGNDVSGPDGLLETPDQHQVWAGDGDSTVKVFTEAGAFVAKISTGGTKRADEMAYDPTDHLLAVANDADSPPFVTLIDTHALKVVGTIKFPSAMNGLEQPVWDPGTHLFYISVPQVGADKAHGEIAAIDPLKQATVKHFLVRECQPAGLTLGPDQHLLVGCGADAIAAGFPAKSLVISAQDGGTVATITQVGGSDEVWFNPGDNHYYLAASDPKSTSVGPALGIVDAQSNMFVQNVKTFAGAHSVAADSKNNHIFVPLPAATGTPAPTCTMPTSGCIGIFAQR